MSIGLPISPLGSGPALANVASMTNDWLERRVLNYAHQGGAKEAPSSTLHAFRRACANGAHALEMDVHCTADGVLVVCHDSTVDRTTPGSGRIADLTMADLAQLDNAHWWVPGYAASTDHLPDAYELRGRAPADPAFGIAELGDVLDEFRSVYLNLDIKGIPPQVAPYEDKLADILRQYERTHDVIVASFHDEALHRFRDLAPEVATSLGMMESINAGRVLRSGNRLERSENQVALQVPHRLHGVEVIDGSLVSSAHASGLAVHVWTIDDPDEMAELLDLGVDAIITDVPSALHAVLAARC